jgi:hypothetical protein
MSRIMSCDYSMSQKDILKFISLFHDPIWLQQYCHFKFDYLLFEL